MYIDDAFREWWVEHLGRPHIPKDCNIIKVHNAIQGHPEAPRLWEKHINKILRAIGLRPTMHEPCLYSGIPQIIDIIFLDLQNSIPLSVLEFYGALHKTGIPHCQNSSLSFKFEKKLFLISVQN